MGTVRALGSKTTAAAVAVAALSIRLLPLPLVSRILPRVQESGFASDAGDYYLPMARTLAEHGEFGFAPGQPTAFHVPLYPLLLAGLIILHLSDPVGVAVVQSILGSATLLLLFVWVRGLAGPRAALIAFMLAAILPDFAVYSYLNMSESLFIVFVLATFVLFEEALRRMSVGLWALAGLTLGLAALTREYSITLLLPLGCAAFGRVGFRPIAARVAVMALAAGLTLAPWMIRNYRVLGEFIPLSTNAGRTIYLATLKGDYNLSDPRRSDASGDPRQAERDRRLREDLSRPMTLREQSNLYLEAAWQNYRDDPWGQLRYLTRKVTFFWQPNVGLRHRGRIGPTFLLAFSEGAYWLCLLAAACSLLVRRFWPVPLLTCVLLVGWTFLFHMFVGEAESRYHFALLPPIFACAGLALSFLLPSAERLGFGAPAPSPAGGER